MSILRRNTVQQTPGPNVKHDALLKRNTPTSSESATTDDSSENWKTVEKKRQPKTKETKQPCMIKGKESKLSIKLNAAMITRREQLKNFLHTLYDKIDYIATRSMEYNQDKTTHKLDKLLRQVKNLKDKIKNVTNAPTIKYIDSEAELLYDKFMGNFEFTTFIS